MPEHFCSACGQEHVTGKSEAVRIAEIQAERDVEIARMEYRDQQAAAALEAETAVVITDMETTADVAVAEAMPDPEPDPEPEPEAEPVPDPVVVEPEPDVPPPPADEANHSTHAPRRGFF